MAGDTRKVSWTCVSYHITLPGIFYVCVSFSDEWISPHRVSCLFRLFSLPLSFFLPLFKYFFFPLVFYFTKFSIKQSVIDEAFSSLHHLQWRIAESRALSLFFAFTFSFSTFDYPAVRETKIDQQWVLSARQRVSEWVRWKVLASERERECNIAKCLNVQQ